MGGPGHRVLWCIHQSSSQSQDCKWEVGGEGAPGQVGTEQSVLLSPEGLVERNKGTQMFLDEALPTLLSKRICSSS